MKLYRSRQNLWLAGVCGGLAEHFGWPSGRLRLVWILATFFTAFAGAIVYLVLWFLMPKAPSAQKNFEEPPLQPWKRSV